MEQDQLGSIPQVRLRAERHRRERGVRKAPKTAYAGDSASVLQAQPHAVSLLHRPRRPAEYEHGLTPWSLLAVG